MLVHAHRVDGGVAAFLHGAAAEGFQPGLGGDGEYRVAVVIRRGDAGNHVGGARPGSGEAHAELAGFPGVAVGHEGGTGLVPGDDQLRPAAAHVAREGVHQRLDGPAQHAEDVLDANLAQVVDDQFTPFECAFGLDRWRCKWRLGGIRRAHVYLPR